MVEAIDEKELAIKVKYFQPDFFKWVIIGNDQYGTISAAHEAFKGFKDLPPVNADVDNAVKGVKGLGAKDADITIMRNPNKKELDDLFTKI